MSDFLNWCSGKLKLSDSELYGMFVIIIVLLIVLGFGAFKQKASIFVHMFIRMAIGVGSILLVNYILKICDISLMVGINAISLLTCAILGIPGVCLLYGILFL